MSSNFIKMRRAEKIFDKAVMNYTRNPRGGKNSRTLPLEL